MEKKDIAIKAIEEYGSYVLRRNHTSMMSGLEFAKALATELFKKKMTIKEVQNITFACKDQIFVVQRNDNNQIEYTLDWKV